MKDVRVQIPPVGEKNSRNDLKGSGFQTRRLDFLGAEDPKGNPRIVEDAGRIDVRMDEGDPVQQSFNSLTIHNEANAEAAGTTAIIRVYEERDSPTPSPQKRKLVARSSPEISVSTFNWTSNLDRGNSFKESREINQNRDRAVRLTGASWTLKDISMSTGVKFSIRALLNGGEVAAVTDFIGVGDTIRGTLMDDLLVPSEMGLYIQVFIHDDPGGVVEWTIGGAHYSDLKSPVPPR